MLVVTFQYFTGLLLPNFESATLHGSWDSQGLPASTWSSVEMVASATIDGCTSFQVQVSFPDSQIGKLFSWHVELTIAVQKRHGITEELNDRNSADTIRQFILGGPRPQIERYRLNWSRFLGAQKTYLTENSAPGIQFSVWAPNARAVDVVMGDMRQLGAVTSAIDPERSPALFKPIPAEAVAGAYISDAGVGTHLAWGPFPMTKASEGVWSTSTGDPRLSDFRRFEHCPYMFRVTRDDGSVVYRTDLYSRCQAGFGSIRPEESPQAWQNSPLTAELDGLVSCSIVKDPDHVCRDFEERVYPEQNWLDADEFWKETESAGAPATPVRIEDLVIYELHVGALGFGKPNTEPGTLKDAIDLLDYLQALGVNAIELLPMAECGGGGSGWGYATSHYFAIEYAGGGRDKYKHFIRECHKRGMAVILDVVFNHYNHRAERAEWMYDSVAHDKNIYYWYEGRPDDYRDFDSKVVPEARGHGGYIDNDSSAYAPRYWDPMVRRMFISSLLALVTEFKVDGFRFDQTTSIHAYNRLHADGTPVGSANIFGQKFLREAVRALRLIKPGVLLMAEDHSDQPEMVAAITTPVDRGGFGFDAKWYSDFYHHLVGDTDKGSDYAKLLKIAGLDGDGPLLIDYFAGALASSGQGRVVYNESHDEAGNGKYTDRTINVAVDRAPLIGDTRNVAEARVRTVAGLTILSAGTPMFLFGEEVGTTKQFIYGKVLENREDLSGLRKTWGKNLFEFYQALIHLRLAPENGALRSRNIETVYTHNSNRILAFRRWNDEANFLILGTFSKSPFHSPTYTIESDKLGNEDWREVFNSDSQFYGGNNIGNGTATLASRDRKLSCALPANGFLVFKRI